MDASSRIFVRGLPPSIAEEDFKKHFSEKASVTDVKLLPKRRFGYVGYKSPEDAAEAVKLFNKSFIRMSRLSVELAQASTKEPSSKRERRHLPEQYSEAVEFSQPGLRKRKRREMDSTTAIDRVDRCMHESSQESKRQLLSSKDHPPERSSATRQTNEGTALEVAEDRKPVQIAADVGIPTQRSIKSSTASETSEDEGMGVVANETNPRTSPGDVKPSNHSTDVDWMRSRTSRLLDLIDDQHDRRTQDVEDTARSQTPPPRRVEHKEKGNTGDIHSNQNTKESDTSDDLPHGVEPLNPATSDHEVKRAPTDQERLRETRRLFLRNLPYSATENDLEILSKSYGEPQEIHIPRGYKTGEAKGIGFIQYRDAESAIRAFEGLDNIVFQGRLLHILVAERKRESKLDETSISQLPLKKQKQIQKKSEALSSTFSWNSMFMNTDAIISSAAASMGVAKSQLLDPTSSDAAVKQAQTETHFIQEAKRYFEGHGANLEAFSKRDRDGLAILVKNFKYDTSADELRSLFSQHGDVTRVLMPPSGTIAIVELANKVQARAAFGALAYRKHRDSVLFLERAPRELFKGNSQLTEVSRNIIKDPKYMGGDVSQDQQEDHQVDSSTLYVRNISFDTSNDRFRDLFRKLDGFLSANIKTKADPKREGNFLNMGFGFVEFRSNNQAKAAFRAMNGYKLDGHELVLRSSNKGLDAAAERRKEDAANKQKQRKSKIIIKNLAFEASKKDIRNLFKTYGQLRAVRVPKKFDNSRKGFAFAEFTTPHEAENAMDALKNTHLLGRRLVLEYAAVDVEDPEEEIQKMQQRVEKQSDNVALRQISKNQRKKLSVGNPDDVEEG